MMEFLEGHLGYLAQYAVNFSHSKKVREVWNRILSCRKFGGKTDVLTTPLRLYLPLMAIY